MQFLYTGDYRYPDSWSSPERPHPDIVEPEITSDVFRNGALTPFAECIHRTFWKHHSLPWTDAAWLESVETAEFNFEDTMLAHATALKALAYGRLSQTLLKLHPFTENPHLARNITILATYVYDNTDSLTSSEELMRRIVSQYVALNFAAWQADPVAEEMMCNGGDFVKDVLRKICRRLGGGGVDEWGLLPVGTRYFAVISVGCSRVGVVLFLANDCEARHSKCYATRIHPQIGRPDRKTDIRSANVSYKSMMRMVETDTRIHRIWLVPIYTMDPTKAATYFSLSPSSGISLSAVMGRSCGSGCRMNFFHTSNAGTALTGFVMVRCPKNYLDLAKFPGFNGVMAHTAHDPGYETLYFL